MSGTDSSLVFFIAVPIALARAAASAASDEVHSQICMHANPPRDALGQVTRQVTRPFRQIRAHLHSCQNDSSTLFSTPLSVPGLVPARQYKWHSSTSQRQNPGRWLRPPHPSRCPLKDSPQVLGHRRLCAGPGRVLLTLLLL